MVRLALILTLGLGMLLGGACQPPECPECPTPPSPPPDYSAERAALIALYDWNGDNCVREADDSRALEAIQTARLGSGLNGWRTIQGQCL